ncbi:hypothetical protein EDO6_01930 [Paenibacillus xylanexedens]|nr:hypothetical protein EDO6_01930 [Paenibacillus xylanexedens]
MLYEISNNGGSNLGEKDLIKIVEEMITSSLVFQTTKE